MANELFLRMDGIDGTSRNYAHRGWTGINTWQWSFERVRKSTAEGPKELTSLNRILVTKQPGIESAMFMKLFADRRVIDSAEISVVPGGGKREAQQKQIGITLNQVLIQSIDTGANTEKEGYDEKLMLVFAKVKCEYFSYTSAVQGGAEASSTSQLFEWQTQSS